MYKLISLSEKSDLIYQIKHNPKTSNQATIWFKNGFLYHGEVRGNIMEGKGLLLLGDGSHYQGCF